MLYQPSHKFAHLIYHVRTDLGVVHEACADLGLLDLITGVCHEERVPVPLVGRGRGRLPTNRPAGHLVLSAGFVGQRWRRRYKEYSQRHHDYYRSSLHEALLTGQVVGIRTGFESTVGYETC